MANVPSGIPMPRPKYPDDNVVSSDEVPVPPFFVDNINISTELDGLQKDVVDAASEVYDWVNHKLAEMESELTPIQMEYRGNVDLQLDEMGSRVAKVALPIIKWIDGKMDELYQHAADGGIPTMSNEGFAMAKGDPSGYVLPYNYIRMYGDGKPFTVNWPTELLGPDPFNTSTNDDTSRSSGTGNSPPPGQVLSSLSGGLSANAPIAGDGLQPLDGGGNGIGTCPPGFAWTVGPDGTLGCYPQEFFRPPPGDNNPPPFFPPPIDTINPPGGGTIITTPTWTGWQPTGKKIYCPGLNKWAVEVTHPTIGIRYIMDLQSPMPGNPGWEYNNPTIIYLTLESENPVVFGYVNTNNGLKGTINCGPAKKEEAPPDGTCPLPDKSCPDLTKVPCDLLKGCPDQATFDCAKTLADGFMYRGVPLPNDLQARIQFSSGTQTREEIIWQYCVETCLSNGDLPIPTPMRGPGTQVPGNSLGTIKPPDWCKDNIFTSLDAFALGLPQTPQQIIDLLNLGKNQDGTWTRNWWIDWIGFVPLLGPVVRDLARDLLNLGAGWVVEAIDSFADPSNPKSKPGMYADIVLGIATKLHNVLGFPPESWIKKLTYMVNSYLPTEIPSPAELGALYKSGILDVSQYRTMVAAHDLCPDWMEKVQVAERSRPDIFQTIDAWRRGMFGDNVRDLRLRQLGVLNQSDQDVLIGLTEALPGMSDLISFMVKDAFDKQLVIDWKLDDEFDQKWTGEAQRLGTAQGVSRDTALLYWLAHWQNISPTQLYQMVGRLRPGRVDKNIEVTRETALRVLGINDYVPYWRERLLAIAEHPLNLSDLQQAYYGGTLTDQEFRDGLLDLLYNPRDIDILMRRYAREKLRRQRFAAGLPTPKDLISMYVDGSIGVVELIDALGEYDWEQVRIQDAIAGADKKREQNLRKSIIRSVKKRYIRRRIDRPEVIGELVAVGLPVDSITYLVRLWETDRVTTQKFIPAGQLCTLWTRGLISNDEYVDGLVRLGYESGQIAAVTGLCGLKKDDARIKDIEKKLKEQEARTEKARKAAEKQAKEMKKEQDAINKKKEACVPKKKRCEALGVNMDEDANSEKTNK